MTPYHSFRRQYTSNSFGRCWKLYQHISLDDGMYVLLSAATWDPTSIDEDVGGYVIYNFLVNVTGRQGV